MTYADTATALRRELSELVIEADVPYRGARPLSAHDSLLVQQFRATILTWLNRSTGAVVPDDVSRSDWQWGPARLFADHLNRITVTTLTLTPPAVHADLGTPRENVTVERWRRAAVAATIGLDRELRLINTDPAVPVYAPRLERHPHRVDYPARLRVVDDNAAFAYALILLDTRVRGRPGWHHLGGFGDLSPRRSVAAAGLLSAVELCRRWTGAHNLPSSVDLRGYQHVPALIPGPVEPGMTGLYAAVHNTALRLDRTPRGDVMGRLVRSQRALTESLTRVVDTDDPSLTPLVARHDRFVQLVNEVRNLGGRVGAGVEVLLDSEQARGVVPTIQEPRPAEIARVVAVFRTIDNAIVDHLYQGVQDRTYLEKTGRHLGLPGPGGVRPATDEWKPYGGQTRIDLLHAARALRPPAAPQAARVPEKPSLVAGPTREMFDETLTAATPDHTAATGPLAGDPARADLSGDSLRRLEAAAGTASPAVQEALRDYYLRRPIGGGGLATHKGLGCEPGGILNGGSLRVRRSPGSPSSTPQSGRTRQDREVPSTGTPQPGLGPNR